MVFRKELYAVPALIGAAILVAASGFGHHGAAAAFIAAIACFSVRIIGLRFDLDLPTAPGQRDEVDG